MDSYKCIIRNVNNPHIVLKWQEAGNETVSFDDPDVSLYLIFQSDNEQFQTLALTACQPRKTADSQIQAAAW